VPAVSKIWEDNCYLKIFSLANAFAVFNRIEKISEFPIFIQYAMN